MAVLQLCRLLSLVSGLEGIAGQAMMFFWCDGSDWVFGPDPDFRSGHWRSSVSIPYHSYADCLTAFQVWRKSQ
jgi:hypothetical protein